MASAWRRWNRLFHRDVGLAMVGLTLLYAVSGVLLNHIHAWNPATAVRRESRSLPPAADPSSFGERDIPALLAALGETQPPTGHFRPDPSTVRLFFSGGRMIQIDLVSGRVEGEILERHALPARLNELHLNRGGRAWTWLADAYAVILGLLALSGVFLIPAGTAVGRRAWWLVGVGFLVPLLFMLWGGTGRH